MSTQTSEFGGPEASPGFLLWHALLRWQRSINAALEPFDLTHMQFVLLVSAWWMTGHNDKPPSQSELAAWVGVDKMTTSQVVRTLERKKLLRREADPDDARALRISPSERGAALAAETIKVVEKVDGDFFADAGDLRAVVEMLGKLAGSEHLFRQTA
jgi:DNA-binding MarR family transcriptional regulator